MAMAHELPWQVSTPQDYTPVFLCGRSGSGIVKRVKYSHSHLRPTSLLPFYHCCCLAIPTTPLSQAAEARHTRQSKALHPPG